MRKRIGTLEIGIFGTSLLVLGLIIWFLTMTFFGSRNNSEAQALLVLGPAQAPLAAPVVSRPVPPPAQPKEQLVAQPAAPPAPVKAPEQEEVPTPNVPEPVVEPQTEPQTQPTMPASLVEETPQKIETSQEAETIEFKPTSLRDPTLSPDDLRAIARRKRELGLKAQKEQQIQVVQKRAIDPFEAVKRKIEVQGVLNNEEGILAIINNQILKKGDEIFGARILQILGNRIILKYQNKVFEKRVKQ